MAEQDDGKFRQEVEGQNGEIEGTIWNYLSGNTPDNLPINMFSLRHDFPTAFHRLTHSPTETVVKLELGEQHFHYFVKELTKTGQTIQVNKAKLQLRVPAGQAVNDFQIAVNDINASQCSREPNMPDVWSVDVSASFAGRGLGEHSFAIKSAGDLAPDEVPTGNTSALDSSKLLDIVLLLEYKVE